MNAVVKNCLVSGRLNELDDKYAANLRVKDELSILDRVVLRGESIVLPKILQNRAVNIAHASHQGIIKTIVLHMRVDVKNTTTNTVW